METVRATLGPKGWSAPVVAALCAVALLLARTAPHGPGLDSDGAQYLAAAASLLEGRGWLGVDGEPYVLWPPLHPTLLALSGGLGLGQGERVVLLHSLALAADALLAAWIAWRLSGSRASAGLASFAVVALALPAAAMAWSEAVFTTLVLASLAALLRWQDRRSLGALAALATCCALALLQRYVGVLLLVSVSLGLLVDRAGGTSGARLRRTLVVAALAALPVVAWATRNALLPSSPAARRGAASDSWGYDLRCALGQFIPRELDIAVLPELGASALLLLGTIALLRRGAKCAEVAVAAFPLAFAAGLVALRHLVEFDPIESRLMSPAHAVACVLGAVGVHRLVSARGRWWSIALLAGWLALAAQRQVVTQRSEFARAKSDGLGLYDNADWRASEALAALRSAPLQGLGFTNEPHALFLLAGLRARALPARPAGYARLYERWSAESESPSWILWFPFGGRAQLPLPEGGIALERTASWADAELWRRR